MNTRVFRIDLEAEEHIDTAIVHACDKQLTEGYVLSASFVWDKNLILIFQKLIV